MPAPVLRTACGRYACPPTRQHTALPSHTAERRRPPARPLTVAADSVEEEADEAQLLPLVHLVLEGLGGVQVRLCVALAGKDATGSRQTYQHVAVGTSSPCAGGSWGGAQVRLASVASTWHCNPGADVWG